MLLAARVLLVDGGGLPVFLLPLFSSRALIFKERFVALCIGRRPLCQAGGAKESGFAQTQSRHRPMVGGGGRAAIAARLLSHMWMWISVREVTEESDWSHAGIDRGWLRPVHPRIRPPNSGPCTHLLPPEL